MMNRLLMLKVVGIFQRGKTFTWQEDGMPGDRGFRDCHLWTVSFC
jgi:hypothetical protein